MWDRKRDPQPPTQPTPQHRPASEAPRPVVAPPPPTPITEGARAVAIIGKGMTIRGEIYSHEDLYLDGRVEGSVEVANAKLTIGPNGQVHSDLKAREVVVMGKVHGNIEAGQKLAIRKDGEVIGDIKAAGIQIDDEAYFKGSIDIVRHEKATAAAS